MAVKYDFNPIDSIMAASVGASLIAVICFAFGVFMPTYTLYAGILIGIVWIGLAGCRRIRFDLKHLLLAGVLAVALVFRLMPFNYVMGGQDQGVYVNMSAHYQKSGKPFISDTVRESITNEETREIYDDANLGRIADKRKIDGMHEGAFAPGVYVKDWDKSQYVFQFYHLHPLWMSMFAHTFGNEARVFSLTVFSLLSILGFYCLSLEMTGNRTASLLTAFFLAINPLHCFFSKFPVSEVPALCFSSFGFYYMARMWTAIKSCEALRANVWVPYCLSLGCFACFFLTRISGFMYLPFFFILCVASVVCLENSSGMRVIASYFAFLAVLYMVSVGYGLFTSFPYSKDIYFKSIEKIHPRYGKEILIALCIVMAATLALVKKYRDNDRFVSFFKRSIEYCFEKVPVVLLLIIAIGLFKIYLLGFTNHYTGDSWISQRWGIAAKHVGSIGHSSILVSIKYISPFLFILFLFSLKALKKAFYGRVILIFLLGFWFHIALLQWIVPYEFYYARYLLTEIVPYTLLAALMCVGSIYHLRWKAGVILLMLLTSVYFLYACALQFGYDISRNPRTAMNELTDEIDEESLLFIKSDVKPIEQIVTPLRFYYGKNTFQFGNWREFSKIVYSDDIRRYAALYVMTGKEHPFDYLRLQKSVRYEYVDHESRKTGWNPHRRPVLSAPLYLYLVDVKKVYETTILKIINPRVDRHLRLSGFYADGYWTDGNALIDGLSVDIGSSESGIVTIKRMGWHPHGDSLNGDTVQVYINHSKLGLIENTKRYMAFSIPPTIARITAIRILSTTFVPAELGINDDKRTLGVDINEIIIWKRPL